MKQTPLRLFLVAALLALPTAAFAQGKPGAKAGEKADKKGEVEDLGGDDTAPPAKPKEGEKSTGKSDGAAAGDSADGGAADFICKANPEACQGGKFVEDYAGKDLKDSQVYAVQQIYALRKKRFELSPYWGVSLNDQFVSHPGPGLAANYYVTNVLAVGMNFNWYQGLNSDAEFNKLVRQSTRLAVPINEYRYGANLNFSYVPIYGKFAGFGDFIFHWDGYIVGGIGALVTRPKAVIDPENRAFAWRTNVAVNTGLGLRVFFNKWLAAFLEVRDYIYNEELENTSVARTATDPKNISGTNRDPSTWTGETRLTNAVQAQFGLSIFLPFTWQYRLAK